MDKYSTLASQHVWKIMQCWNYPLVNPLLFKRNTAMEHDWFEDVFPFWKWVDFLTIPWFLPEMHHYSTEKRSSPPWPPRLLARPLAFGRNKATTSRSGESRWRRTGAWEREIFGAKRGYMDVSENGGTPKSSILIGFSILNHPFWGTPIFGNIHINLFPNPFSWICLVNWCS